MESTGEPIGRASRVGFWLGLALFVTVLLTPVPEPRESAKRTAAATLLIATWWVTEAIPIPATSLLPLALFPLLGASPITEIASAYAKPPVFLFLGGFILALGIERWQLHRRIALAVVRGIGTAPRQMVLGFMTATALLSMWISNTAATLMMLPIALAVLAALGDLDPDRETTGPLGLALMLGIAYAASIGGLATLIGTPPNLVLETQLRLLADRLDTTPPELSMGRWMLVFVPLSGVFLFIAWRFLVRGLKAGRTADDAAAAEVLDDQWRRLGPMTRPERRMLALFAVTGLLWVFRRDLPLGPWTLPGWEGLFETGFVDDAVVAVSMAAISFVLPSGDGENPSEPLMNWQTAVRLPWGILLLFGGGFAVAKAFGDSGLSAWIGEVFGQLPIGSALLLVLATCALMTFLTELTSNVATANVMLPILGSTAIGLGIDPLLLMLPATISASCAFMLPVATPPNAIVFSSGRVTMKDMAQSGLFLNVVGILLVTATVYLLGIRGFGITPRGLPPWLTRHAAPAQSAVVHTTPGYPNEGRGRNPLR